MSRQTITHNYYYGSEADQYVFYRFPKALITNDYYAGVSDSAKILYGLMLDRMGLSIKNRWLDEKRRVFIYFTLVDIQEAMRCGHNKGVKIVSELEQIGLIERVKQGQGKPAIIYVKRFVEDADSQNSNRDNRCASRRDQQNGLSENQDIPKEEARISVHGKPALPQCGNADFRKGDTNNTEFNHNDFNDNHPIQSNHEADILAALSPDRWDNDWITNFPPFQPSKKITDAFRRAIRHRVDYYSLIEPSAEVEAQVDEIVELIVETLCSTRTTIQIAGDVYPAEMVKERFAKITDKHITYVMDCMQKNTVQIRNIKKYLLTTLFNAPATMDHYYSAEFNHLYHGGNP